MTPDLPVFVQPADSFLQPLLLLLREDVCQLIARLQEHAEHTLVQLTKKILHHKKDNTKNQFDYKLYLINN